MVSTINPIVYRNQKLAWARWVVLASVYTIASAAGGGAVGLVFGILGSTARSSVSLLPSHIELAIALLCFAYALHELQLVKLPHPQRRAQVPSWWRNTFHPVMTASLFGALLGVGVTTYTPSMIYHLTLLSAALQGPFWSALSIGLFGLVRAILLWPLVVLSTQVRVEKLAAYIDLTQPIVRHVCGAVLAVCTSFWAFTALRHLLG